MNTLQLLFEGVNDKDLLLYQQTIHTLFNKGVLAIKDGSAEIFFDDLGQVQQITYRIKKVKREGEEFGLRNVKSASAMAHFDTEGNLRKIIYETIWKRSKEGLTHAH